MVHPRRGTDAAAAGSSGATDNSIRIVRSTFVPAWSVPPKVLLVEDDEICRNLTSRHLQARRRPLAQACLRPQPTADMGRSAASSHRPRLHRSLAAQSKSLATASRLST